MLFHLSRKRHDSFTANIPCRVEQFYCFRKQHCSPVINDTVSTERNNEDKKTQQSNTVNDELILCIQIFGCVDILLICTYSAVCIYDRQHRTVGDVNTYENVSGNNSYYENAGIWNISRQQETNYCNVWLWYGVSILHKCFSMCVQILVY